MSPHYFFVGRQQWLVLSMSFGTRFNVFVVVVVRRTKEKQNNHKCHDICRPLITVDATLWCGLASTKWRGGGRRGTALNFKRGVCKIDLTMKYVPYPSHGVWSMPIILHIVDGENDLIWYSLLFISNYLIAQAQHTCIHNCIYTYQWNALQWRRFFLILWISFLVDWKGWNYFRTTSPTKH